MTSTSPVVRMLSLVAACLLPLLLQSHHTNAFQPPAAFVLSSSSVITSSKVTVENTALSYAQKSIDHGFQNNNDNDDELSKKRPNSRRKFIDEAMKASGVTASTLTFGMFANFEDMNINANAMDLNNSDHPFGCTCALW